MGRVLLIDDDAKIRRAFEYLVEESANELQSVSSAEAAFAVIDRWKPEVVVLDVHLPGMDGLEAVRQFRDRLQNVPIIMITGESTMDIAVEAARLGTWEYRTKPFDPAEMLALLERALEAGRQAGAGAGGAAEPAPQGSMVGQSRRMQEVYRSIGRVAATEASVLIRGESGTGKELVAQAIHEFGPNGAGPLVTVNCVAIPETLLESELFGHERGAFTGAVGRRPGKFELAAGGTILLDEIGDLPLGLQGKILRVLQERTFDRVGGDAPLRVEARILAATNRDLEDAMRRGAFREDLYHRLNVVTIHLPALRDRMEDLDDLVALFVGRFARELGCAVPLVTKEAMDVLRGYSWPGNVRELAHCLKSAMVLTRGFPLRPEDLRRNLQVGAASEPQLSPGEALERYVRAQLTGQPGGALHEELTSAFEAMVLREALRLAGGRQSEAARLLGLPRPTLHAKLQRHGIRVATRVEPAADD